MRNVLTLIPVVRVMSGALLLRTYYTYIIILILACFMHCVFVEL